MANDSRDYILVYDNILTALSRGIERALLDRNVEDDGGLYTDKEVLPKDIHC